MNFPNTIINYLTDKKIDNRWYKDFFKDKEYKGFRTHFLKTLASCIDRTRRIKNSSHELIKNEYLTNNKKLESIHYKYEEMYKRLSLIFEELKTDQPKMSMEFFVLDTVKYLNKLRDYNEILSKIYIIKLKEVMKKHFSIAKINIQRNLKKVRQELKDKELKQEELKEAYNEKIITLYDTKKKEMKSQLEPFLASLPDLIGIHTKSEYMKLYNYMLGVVNNKFENYNYFEVYTKLENKEKK